jgi:hypothetical protein
MAALSIVAVVAVALAALAGAPASADKPTIVEAGDLLPIVNGGFSPKALPRAEFAHVAMGESGSIKPLVGGARPSALQEVILELDRNLAIDARGLSVCPPGNVESLPPPERCSSALVGRGAMEVEVEFPEQKPFTLESKLFAFNAGIRERQRTIYLYAYLMAPISASVVSTIKVSKVHDSRYGMRWVESFPKIAGGYGSITDFSLTIDKQFGFRGKRRSFLLAKCPDGHLNALATSIFSDGSEQQDSFARACTPQG